MAVNRSVRCGDADAHAPVLRGIVSSVGVALALAELNRGTSRAVRQPDGLKFGMF